MDRQVIDLQELYNQDLFNRHYLFKNVNYKQGKYQGLKLAGTSTILMVKLLISRFIRPNIPQKNKLFISWSPLHSLRSDDLSEEFLMVEYKRLSFSRKQLQHFSSISIKDLIICLSQVRKSDLGHIFRDKRYVNDIFFYRVLFVLEFLVIEKIVYRSEQVYMAGINDRLALIISKICETYDVHLSMLQHGILGGKEHWRHLKANRFYYLFPFSKNFIQHQIEVTPATEMIYLPKKKSYHNLKIFEKGQFNRNIAYATSPADSEKDVEILKSISPILLKKEYNLLIYPHPLEKETIYEELKTYGHVHITRERHENISFLISRYSTLGIDYYEQGITPIFLNFENHDFDFLKSGIFQVFNNLMEFDNWVKTDIR